MPTTLDPRMISLGQPLAVNSVIANSLSSLNATSNNTQTTNLTADTIINTNINVTNLTATGDVVSNYFILTADSDFTFSDADNSKAYHFNTSTTPIISAFFPDTISNGFNVTIVNIGTGAIYLSASPTLNAIGTYNAIQYTGVLIYKQNDQFYGIGVFE